MRKHIVTMLWLVLLMFAVPVLAAEVVEDYPWADVVVWGIAWGPLVSVIIEIAKAFRLNERYIPVINWTLGFVGLTLFQLSQGQELVLAVISGLVAVMSAPGFYESITKPIKSAVKKS